jgi:hypothetical protein
LTHNVDPHGIVTGTTIHSPLVIVGYRVDLARLGLDDSSVYRLTDLWTGATRETQTTLDLSLSPAQSMVQRLVGTYPAP